VQVDDPVHEVEAHEAHWEHDTGILVDVGGGAAIQLVQALVGVLLGHGVALGGRRGLFVGPAVDGVLQGAALGVGLRVMNLVAYLLEERGAAQRVGGAATTLAQPALSSTCNGHRVFRGVVAVVRLF